MHNRTDFGTTQRILMGLVVVAEFSSPARAEMEKKMAKQESDHHKAVHQQAKYDKNRLHHQQPTHVASHQPTHKHPSTQACKKRY
tara:strand:+ start:1767 stop:2021 length:255 start_codon:yes stop_codon:yes gene_type:complete